MIAWEVEINFEGMTFGENAGRRVVANVFGVLKVKVTTNGEDEEAEALVTAGAIMSQMGLNSVQIVSAEVSRCGEEEGGPT